MSADFVLHGQHVRADRLRSTVSAYISGPDRDIFVRLAIDHDLNHVIALADEVIQGIRLPQVSETQIPFGKGKPSTLPAPVYLANSLTVTGEKPLTLQPVQVIKQDWDTHLILFDIFGIVGAVAFDQFNQTYHILPNDLMSIELTRRA